jgi:hypothetical protein
MEGLGDCPQFVCMVDSAVQNLINAQPIRNEGLTSLFFILFSLNVSPRSLQISRDSQGCSRIIFCLKQSNCQLFSQTMGDLVPSCYQGASEFMFSNVHF